MNLLTLLIIFWENNPLVVAIMFLIKITFRKSNCKILLMNEKRYCKVAKAIMSAIVVFLARQCMDVKVIRSLVLVAAFCSKSGFILKTFTKTDLQPWILHPYSK